MRSAKVVLVAVLAAATAIAAPAFAQQYVPGYYRADGTYVQGYYRTVPDNNPYNNYSTRGNVNPYTGKPGYRNPRRPPTAYTGMPSIIGIQKYVNQGFTKGQQERKRQLELQRLQQQRQSGGDGG